MEFNIQQEKEAMELIAIHSPQSIAVNHYKMLFSKVNRICRRTNKKVIAVTSSVKGEGKTTTVSNLAVVGAKIFGERTLLIDGDFNAPSLPMMFGLPKGHGLVDIVEGKCRIGEAIQKTSIENLAILHIGRIKPEGKDNNIWASKQIAQAIEEIRECFDYVWIDAPPILPLFDMNVISQLVDGMLMVVQAGKIPKAVISRSLKSIDSQKFIGSIFNRSKVSWPQKDYTHHYSY